MFQPCEVVLLPFPFSDLSSTKRRPALVLRSLATYGDIVALAIASRSGHPAGIALDWVRCDQLHTFDQSLILGRIGKLTPEAYERVLKAVCSGLGCVEGA